MSRIKALPPLAESASQLLERYFVTIRKSGGIPDDIVALLATLSRCHGAFQGRPVCDLSDRLVAILVVECNLGATGRGLFGVANPFSLFPGDLGAKLGAAIGVLGRKLAS
ncbi:hypothetical protein J8273_0735 [Carpediemonas membranifera]|uniref:Uncharacterized protein n=1 Tax=Carpediemonas membranifera TaxID=201153 RepID=A0A8J6B3K7_9EUKA|nr:hypothetical protein J8273_0735 [Carpediemonas membranifera]|eukprot:KAG9397605.1 hypothetical protein J8273_0735 [Carpediemonas membranifera]